MLFVTTKQRKTGLTTGSRYLVTGQNKGGVHNYGNKC